MRKKRIQNCITCSKEYANQLSFANTRKNCSKECSRIYFSNLFKGRVLTKEWKEKIGRANSISLLGKKLSESHKKNIGLKSLKHGLSRTVEYSRFKNSKRRAMMRTGGDLTIKEWIKIKKDFKYMCMPLTPPGSTIRVSDFINESEIPTPQSDAEGKVAKLESDGKLSKEFLRLSPPIIRTYLNAGSPHTWTKPAGLSHIVAEVQGGGGSGEFGSGGSGATAYGGGAGGYAKGIFSESELNSTETVTVGAGGASSGENDGNDSVFKSLIGGKGYSGDSPSGAGFDGVGGTASGGSLNIPGGNSFRGSDTKGGDSVLGRGGNSNSKDGQNGGGGWGRSTSSGVVGGGGDGIVIVTEYYL
jgi:hypothetical protein